MYEFWISVFTIAVRIMFSFSVEREENMPRTGAVVLASNHTSAWDPILVGVALKLTINRQIHYMGKSELFEYPLLKQILPGMNVFPVHRGRPDRAAIKHSIDVLLDGNVLGIFPEGHRHYDGQIRDALPGAAYFSAKTNATVVPAAVRIGKGLRPRVLMRFGEPVQFPEISGKISAELLEERTNLVMERIKTLYDQMAGAV